nr:hypothetical protein [Rickettsia conorii]
MKADFVKNAPYQNNDKIFLPKNFESLKRLINSSYEYSRTAKPILDLTANLILTPEERNEISSKYNDSKALIKYLKNETILPIFYFNNYRPEKADTKDKDLTSEQVYYLERIGDLIHRESDDRAAEFIVRYLEISIDNLLHPIEDSRIINAIQPLADFGRNT